MKTPITPIWIPGLVLAMVWLPGGLAQDETNRPRTSTSDATPVVNQTHPATDASPRGLTSPLDVSSPAVIALPNDAALKDRRPPSKIRLSPWTAEIVKLAGARIEDDVMFSFIDNSGTFNLGTDQIVYLSDLGISSQIISAMLQHDQDLVSGARPLTIASEPAYETILPEPIVVSSGPNKPSPQPALAAATVVPMTASAAAKPNASYSPEINPGVPDGPLAARPSTKTEQLASSKPSALIAQRQPAIKTKSLYPVRESRPVELTAPIIFVDGEDRPANTIIIVGFPRTEPVTP